jgi:hypothetical protein
MDGMGSRQLTVALAAWCAVWCAVSVAAVGASEGARHAMLAVAFGPLYVAALVAVYQWVGARLTH